MSIILDEYGEKLRIQSQNFVIDGKKSSSVIPFHKARRAVLSSGNSVSTTALFWLAQYGIETAIVSKTGKLVATIVPTGNEARGDIV